MVGNDVVDLRDRDSDPSTLHSRFDERVLAPNELRALCASSDAPTHRWRLWAAKEAAYKALKKLDNATVFSPTRFRVALRRLAGAVVAHTGTVACGAERCDVRVEERDGFVHAIARVTGSVVRTDRERLLSEALRVAPNEIGRDAHAPGRIARELALSRIAAVLSVAPDALEIRKEGRIPKLWLHGEPAPCDLSLSHHGEVVAFACLASTPGALPVFDFRPSAASAGTAAGVL
jgi:phosphopantetheine--protein transferase-like protein